MRRFRTLHFLTRHRSGMMGATLIWGGFFFMGRYGQFFASRAVWFWIIGAVGAMLLAFASGAVIWTSLWTEPARQEIEDGRSRALEAIISANAVETAVLDRQRIMRGKVIEGPSEKVEIPDLNEAKERIDRLAMLVRDDPVQQKRVSDLGDLVANQEKRIKETADSILAGDIEGARERIRTGIGDRSVEGVRRVVGAIVGAERSNLQDLRVDAGNIARESENYTYAIGLICLLVVVLGGTAVLVSLRSTWSLRLREMERLNEERMRIAHEATGAGTWEHFQGALLWSPETYLLYDRDSRLGVPSVDEWRTMLHPDDLESCPWTAAMVPVGSFANTFRIATPSGSWRWIASRGFSFRRDGVDRLVGMDVDVTEQVSAREELARLNKLLSEEAASDRRDKELVFEAAGDMMAVVSAKGALVSVNPAWSRVLGWDADELIGRQVADFVADDSSWQAEMCSFSAQMKCRSGEMRLIEWSTAWDEGGRAILAGRDMTEQRAAEMRLRAAEETVRQMQKIESVGQMTGGIAHDFNNMLTPIFGYLEMIQKRHADDQKTARMVNFALQSAEKAKTLVSKLLSFARRQQLEYKVVDAGKLVSGMTELVEKSVATPGVEMEVCVEEGPMCVRVDPNQFEMVLMNLAVNARDAMPQGGKLRIDVHAAKGAAAPGNAGISEGDYIVVSVSDTGTGMDEETLQRAVEPFYSTKGMGKGTGLGLSMAHGMAGQSGGGLVLESTPGKGTKASVWLPVVDPSLLVRPSDATMAPTSDDATGINILLVDDEEIVRNSIEQMLIGMGHNVKTAASGAQALSMIAADDGFDLLVTDYLMPSMTGGQLIERVREVHPGLPAVIVSGYTNVTDQIDVPGAVRLAKPFTSVKLSEALRRVAPPHKGEADNVVEMRRRS